MLRKLIYNFIILSFFLVLSCQVSFAGNDNNYSATVTTIIDGDTIHVQRGSTTKVIRLWGVDAPEWDQPYSIEAKRFLQHLLLNQTVGIQHLYTDDYARSIALVIYKKVNINHLLVKNGYAWVHDLYCKESVCIQWKKTEKQAREDGKGLWASPNPVSPWEWKWQKRKTKKKQKPYQTIEF